jgi:hypothetical protein
MVVHMSQQVVIVCVLGRVYHVIQLVERGLNDPVQFLNESCPDLKQVT